MSINSPDSLPGDELEEGSAPSEGNADGGIPGGKDGVGISDGAAPNTFEPEEDPDAAADPAD